MFDGRDGRADRRERSRLGGFSVSGRRVRFSLGLQAESLELFLKNSLDLRAGETQDDVFRGGGDGRRATVGVPSRVPLELVEGFGEVFQAKPEAVEELLQGLEGGGLSPGQVAAEHGRRDLGSAGNVLEGPAIADTEGSQGFG